MNIFIRIFFFLNKSFQVITTNQLSDNLTQENGILQESALLVSLFLMVINNLDKHSTFLIKANIFADDANLFCIN